MPNNNDDTKTPFIIWTDDERRIIHKQLIEEVRNNPSISRQEAFSEAQKLLPEDRRRKVFRDPKSSVWFSEVKDIVKLDDKDNVVKMPSQEKEDSRRRSMENLRKAKKVWWSKEETKLVFDAAVEFYTNRPSGNRHTVLDNVQRKVLPKERWRRTFNSPKAARMWKDIKKKANHQREMRQIKERNGISETPKQVPATPPAQVPQQALQQAPQPSQAAPEVSAPQSPPKALTEAAASMSVLGIFQRFELLVSIVEEMLPQILDQLQDTHAIQEMLVEHLVTQKSSGPPRKIDPAEHLNRKPKKVAILGTKEAQAQIVQSAVKGLKIEVTNYKDSVPTGGEFDLIIASRWLSHGNYERARKVLKGPFIVCHGGSTSIATSIQNYFLNEDQEVNYARRA